MDNRNPPSSFLSILAEFIFYHTEKKSKRKIVPRAPADDNLVKKRFSHGRGWNPPGRNERGRKQV
jgi:hypothetical protein